MKVTPAFEFHLRELLAVQHHKGVASVSRANLEQPDTEPHVKAFLARYCARPTVLNGYPVIAMLPRERAPINSNGILGAPLGPLLPPIDFVVVVQRDDDHTPFVVARWAPSCGDSWDLGTYTATLAEAMTIAIERSNMRMGAKLPQPHDAGSAPPAGFARYQIELDIPSDTDSSDLLKRVQDLTGELIEESGIGEINGGDDDDDEVNVALLDRIGDRVSVQRMEG